MTEPTFPTQAEMIAAIATIAHVALGDQYASDFVFDDLFQSNLQCISEVLEQARIFEPKPNDTPCRYRLACAPAAFRATAEKNMPDHVCYWRVARILVDTVEFVVTPYRPGAIVESPSQPDKLHECGAALDCLERLRFCERDDEERLVWNAIPAVFDGCNRPSPLCARERCITHRNQPRSDFALLNAIWSVFPDNLESLDKALASMARNDKSILEVGHFKYNGLEGLQSQLSEAKEAGKALAKLRSRSSGRT